MDKNDILEIARTIATIAWQILFIFYVDKIFTLYVDAISNSFFVAFLACILLNIFWNQIAISKALDKTSLDKTSLDINNPNHIEEIARYAIEEKNRLWPWIAVSWFIVPTIYELMKILWQHNEFLAYAISLIAKKSPIHTYRRFCLWRSRLRSFKI